MKKSALSVAVVAMFGVLVLAGPVLAQNHTNIVTQTSVDSKFFGFVPSQANIQTFTQNVNAISCNSPTVPTTCSSSSYVKNNQMPGSFTDRPDTGGNTVTTFRAAEVIVSSQPDFGCGVWTTNGTAVVPLVGASNCLESSSGGAIPGINLHDRVNGNINTAGNASDAINSGLGQNTAFTAQNGFAGVNGNGIPNGTCVPLVNCQGTDAGTLVGTMVSNVTIAQSADEATEGMPSGSISFSRTESGTVSFDENIFQVISSIGLNFNEHDTMGAIQARVPGAPVVNGTANCRASATTPCNTGDGRTSGGGELLPSYIPAAGLPLTATLSITQTSMGGEGSGTDVIGPYTVKFPGNGGYPVTGMFFTPGLGVADWQNNGAVVDTDGFPN